MTSQQSIPTGVPVDGAPGAWPETPIDIAALQQPSDGTQQPIVQRTVIHPDERDLSLRHPEQSSSADRTAVPSPVDSENVNRLIDPEKASTVPGGLSNNASATASDNSSEEEKANQTRQFEPINPTKTSDSTRGLPLAKRTTSGRQLTEDDLLKALSRRRTNASGRTDSIATVDSEHEEPERAEIERLLSRMFGKGRQAHSEEEKTRHVGLIFKHLTVKGMGLGAALQPTNGDILLGIPRLLKRLFTKGSKVTAGKPPIRTLIDDFTGCVKPGEMLLVLGRPGSGCSTFLKVLGNQRFGYHEVTGEVTYGGTSAKEMMKNFRGEVLYNPEDDLHFATLTVKETLTFALRTRTPGKSSREEGESRSAYVREFLRVVAKLFWIEHTLGTKVGDPFIRGVSGGEKKRVSIAEAMITKASTQCWDNSTRSVSHILL